MLRVLCAFLAKRHKSTGEYTQYFYKDRISIGKSQKLIKQPVIFYSLEKGSILEKPRGFVGQILSCECFHFGENPKVRAIDARQLISEHKLVSLKKYFGQELLEYTIYHCRKWLRHIAKMPLNGN